MGERWSGLFSLVRSGLIQTRWWLTRQVWTLIWPLFAWSAWAQPATVVAGKTGGGYALATIRSVCLGSASHSGG